MKYSTPVAEKLSVEAINVLLASNAVPPACPRNNDLPIICDDD